MEGMELIRTRINVGKKHKRIEAIKARFEELNKMHDELTEKMGVIDSSLGSYIDELINIAFEQGELDFERRILMGEIKELVEK